MFSRFQPSPDNLLQVQQSFDQVIVDLDDGNQFLMSKCSNCGFICRNNMNTKHAHWKRCPWKFSFKYISQNESTMGCVAACTLCNMKFMSPDMITMKTHSQKCLRNGLQQKQSTPYTFDNSNMGSKNRIGANGVANAINNIHENVVSRKEIDAQRKVLMMKSGKTPIPGFRIKYISNENGPERYSECLICKTLFRKPTAYTLKAHRRMCSYPANNVLMTVQTQSLTHPSYTPQSTPSQSLDFHQQLPYRPMPTHRTPYHSMPSDSMMFQPIQSSSMPPRTIVSQPVATQPFDATISSSVRDTGFSRFTITGNSSRLSTPSPVKMCFICNTTSSQSFVSLYQTISTHSHTKIYDFVWKFLNDQPSVRDSSTDAANSNWSLVCTECLDMINEYDYARVTAAKFENCLRDKLSQTETYYTNKHRPLESPATIAQRERDRKQQQNYIDEMQSDNVNATRPNFDDRYADDLNDAVQYLVELSDEEDFKEVAEERVQTIELSDEDGA